MIIHVAEWVASLLFLIAVAAVGTALLWRFRIAVTRVLIAFVGLTVLAGFGIYWWNDRAAAQAAEQARVAAVKQRDAETAQRESEARLLQDSIVTAQTAAIANAAPPIPEFTDVNERLAYLRWLGEMSGRLIGRMPDWAVRKEFLQTLWYESRRAGLDTSLVLGLIQSSSNFQKFYVSDRGSRGFLAVGPHWVADLGDGDVQKLFHMQTNLRYGCVMLRHYIDQNRGDLFLSLQQYLADSRGLTPNSPAMTTAVDGVFAAQGLWVFSDVHLPPPLNPGG